MKNFYVFTDSTSDVEKNYREELVNEFLNKINSLPGGEGAVDQALQSGSIAIMVIGLGFAMVGTMHKSMQLVNDVFGA